MPRLAHVPKTGTIIPEMGTNARAKGKGLAGALFSPVQQRVLGLLFGQPERKFGSGEIIREVGSGTGAAHRQLQRLAGTGLVIATRLGNQKHYQANRDSPIYPELHSLIVKTVGLVEPLRQALAPLAKQIDAAFVFGSVAKKTDRADSDLDVLILSDKIGYTEAFEALQRAERQLARSINPTVMTRADWKRKRRLQDSFARRIAEQPKIFILGSEDALG